MKVLFGFAGVGLTAEGILLLSLGWASQEAARNAALLMQEELLTPRAV